MKVPFPLMPPADLIARAKFSWIKPRNAHGRKNLLSFLATRIRELSLLFVPTCGGGMEIFMTFQDIFKSSFLDSVTQFSLLDVCIGMLVSLCVGLFIFWVYKKTFAGVMYSTGFSLALVGLSLVTTLVIMAVTSNVVLSLGMVGALSIVRFRAAIKEPMEIVYLFWAIAAGIVIGAGMIPLAIIGSLFIGLILWILASRKVHNTPYILVLQCDHEDAETSALQILSETVSKQIVKTKTITADGMELTVEIRTKDANTTFVNQISKLEGVACATLVSYNGEYMS